VFLCPHCPPLPANATAALNNIPYSSSAPSA
jgi:hypothetical protein